MVRKSFIIVFLYIFCGTVIILFGGCKKQESAKLTITVDGRELSDAHLFIDDKQVGSLTQTIISADGKVFIDGKLAARLHPQGSSHEPDTYTGCSDPIHLPSGKHTITLQKNEDQPLKIAVNIPPGYHLLTVLPDKNLVKWNNTSLQIGPEKTVTIASEKTK
jgi:hypothetical protein